MSKAVIPSGVELFYQAKEASSPMERLALLQLSSEAFQARGRTLDDVGLKPKDIIAVANTCYQGSAPETAAIHCIATQIIASFPVSRSKPSL